MVGLKGRMETNFPHHYDGKKGNKTVINQTWLYGKKKLFNSVAVAVTSTLYPSYLIVFLVKMATLPFCGRHIGYNIS